MIKNLSKTFKYVNEKGDTLIFEYNHGYLINKPNGIDTVNITLSQAQSINQVGSTVNSKTVQARPITISGIIVGPDQEARKEKLIAVVRGDLAGRLYADDYYLDVHITATPTVGERKRFANFQFSLNAPYPYWQMDKKVSKHLTGIQGQFKFPWNMSQPYRFGQLMQAQFINVRNDGQLPVPFTATFKATGQVEYPRILNIQTGEEMIIDYALRDGETITVEIGHERTKVNSNLRYTEIPTALSLDSTLFRLKAGDNILKPSAGAGFENLEIHIAFAPEKSGVTV